MKVFVEQPQLHHRVCYKEPKGEGCLKVLNSMQEKYEDKQSTKWSPRLHKVITSQNAIIFYTCICQSEVSLNFTEEIIEQKLEF